MDDLKQAGGVSSEYNKLTTLASLWIWNEKGTSHSGGKKLGFKGKVANYSL